MGKIDSTTLYPDTGYQSGYHIIADDMGESEVFLCPLSLFRRYNGKLKSPSHLGPDGLQPIVLHRYVTKKFPYRCLLYSRNPSTQVSYQQTGSWRSLVRFSRKGRNVMQATIDHVSLTSVSCEIMEAIITRSQAIARIADRTAKNCRGHVT